MTTSRLHSARAVSGAILGVRAQLLVGDVRACLRALPAGLAQTCVTSPPYFGVRNYGTTPQVWGGREDCGHAWEPVRVARPNSGGGKTEKQSTNTGSYAVENEDRATYSARCEKCQAWKGELGQEETPAEFVSHLMEVFREVRRVLRPDGTVWLNMGDCYSAGGRSGHGSRVGCKQGTNRASADRVDTCRPNAGDLPAKNLCLIPQRLAIALQDDGWYVRCWITWHKPNGYCESVEDRPGSKDQEVILLLTQRPRYYYDRYAVLQPYAESTLPQKRQAVPVGAMSLFGEVEAPAAPTYNGNGLKDYEGAGVQNPSDLKRRVMESLEKYEGANLRSVWSIPTQGTSAEHYAAYPEEIPRRCIAAGTSEAGQCPECGSPWVRVVEKEKSESPTSHKGSSFLNGKTAVNGAGRTGTGPRTESIRPLGWESSCTCRQPHPVPQVVLEPFAGTATTGAVAVQMGRSVVLGELQTAYAPIIRDRMERALDGGLFGRRELEVLAL